MTAVRATRGLGPAFDEKKPSRRQLPRAGVWAAPVIVLATAAPAAAASGPGATHSGDALVSNTFSLYNESIAGQGTVQVAISYRRGVFPQGGNVGNAWVALAVPAQLTAGWQVVAIGPGSASSETIVASGSATAEADKQSANETYRFNLAPGSYRFELRFTSATFAANPVTQPDGSEATFANTSTNPLAQSTLTIT